MASTATAAAGSQVQPVNPPAASGATVPYFFGANKYVEKITIDSYQVTTGGSQEFVHNITPGGFMQGVRVEVRSSGGSGGTAATADNPGIVIQSASIENIDGGPIQYPMDGWAYLVGNSFFRPWQGWFQNRYDYVAGINPSFSLFLQPEIRHTAGVLANTDARAQYRVRTTFNTGAKIFTGAPTYPLLAVQYYLESWAQPDAQDLHQNAIQPVPDGLNLATQRRHQILPMNSGSALNQFQLSNTGNEMRGILLIVRDNNGVRQDYLTDPIRWRLDNRTMGTFSPNEVFNRMADFYQWLGTGSVQRPTGVYMWPRFFQPGELFGEAWLATTNATYTIFETSSAAGLASPGTVEAITDEVIPVGNVPAELESI
jgi:hypothetical protein